VDDVVVFLLHILANPSSDERNELALKRDGSNNASKCAVDLSCCRSMLVIDIARICTLLKSVKLKGRVTHEFCDCARCY